MLVDAPEVEEVLKEFKDFMGDDILVAHNASLIWVLLIKALLKRGYQKQLIR